MIHQLKAIPKVIYSPREAFRSLPSDRWYVLAWLAPVYFGIARAFRPPRYEQYVEQFGGPIQLLIFTTIIGLIAIPLWALILRQILKIFRKYLSVKKLMNIHGYSLVPRLIVALIAYIIMFLSPSTFTDIDGFTPTLMVIVALGFIGIIYTLFLYVYGIVVSPSEE